ncbi:MAG: hypothetical protein JWM33_2122, partial [Caulobacteraceae bacterium]|nr:hypothetical protein [Caulobacteraceae bacterium]
LAPVSLPMSIGGEPRSPFQVDADCRALPIRIRPLDTRDPTLACYTRGKLISKAKMVTPDDAPPGYRVEDLPQSERVDLEEVTALYSRQEFSPTQMPQGKWSIVYSGHQLTDALSASVGLQGSFLTDQLGQFARSAGVPAKAIAVDFTAAERAYIEGPSEVQAACLDTIINQARSGQAPIVKSLEAWAHGDLPNSFAQVGCLEDKTAIYGQIADATAQTIRSYLNQPGDTVAAVELIPLLMNGGVIEQLKGWRYSISGPEVN